MTYFNNHLLREKLRGTPEERKQALDCLTDFVRVAVREERLYCRAGRPFPVAAEELICLIDGLVPLYWSDLDGQAGVRLRLLDRLRAHMTKVDTVTLPRYVYDEMCQVREKAKELCDQFAGDTSKGDGLLVEELRKVLDCYYPSFFG